MRTNEVSFESIVTLLKEDVNLNIFEMCHKLSCSEGVLYRRMIPEGYKGLSELKDAVKEGQL